jgi:hypothetical protein
MKSAPCQLGAFFFFFNLKRREKSEPFGSFIFFLNNYYLAHYLPKKAMAQE